MIDLHTHTFFSDGVLIPSELAVRASKNGVKTIAITDHGDFSNLDFVIPRIKKAAKILTEQYPIRVIPGIELTYVPPKLIAKAAKTARKLGAEVVVVHGETPVECVPEGTNLEAIKAKVDILAHPGFIKEAEAALAKKNGVYLEITARNGHKNANPHVYRAAGKTGASLVMNTDTHMPENIMSAVLVDLILKEFSLTKDDFEIMQSNSLKLLQKKGRQHG